MFNLNNLLPGYLVFIHFHPNTSIWILISVLLKSYYYSFICYVISPWNLVLFVPKNDYVDSKKEYLDNMFLKPEYNLAAELFIQTTVVIRLEW